MIRTALVAAALLLPLSSVHAQNAAQPKLIRESGDWRAVESGAGAERVCFVMSQPKARAPAGLNRDPAYLYISFRPQAGVRNEVSILTGFPMQEGSQPTVTIGEREFTLQGQAEQAWLANAAEEGPFVQQARAGAQLVFKATSRRGNALTDTYSLAGLTQALEAAQRACSD
jgi:invasion protein IalB